MSLPMSTSLALGSARPASACDTRVMFIARPRRDPWTGRHRDHLAGVTSAETAQMPIALSIGRSKQRFRALPGQVPEHDGLSSHLPVPKGHPPPALAHNSRECTSASSACG
jgi:hypothetical protein